MDFITRVSLDQVDNRFLFVMVAAKRALQLQRGAKPRADVGIRKPTVVAMLESLEQKVSYELPDKPKEKKSRK
ncbi:DNA-directed RNA polymerase subunit omega [bacterium]|nr:DNA-directed RNA polymerase subunit omega [bacterium]MCI0613632.1 DNA-directed RNA polymerase subunit omega [bacterium]